eukprot:TRINITY_DN1071_c0_g1_i5.p2 TRINITY_DN1071_c0_g1~~TRINITY_DN1071_c0_g1_i5.p2  ORF type:complete len:114 (+),score=5.50 TRINITY_DN1071_c0_g1_i5:760-1101(+)
MIVRPFSIRSGTAKLKRKVALRLISIPPSVTAVDSVFSSFNSLMTSRRSNISPTTLSQKLMVYRNRDVLGEYSEYDDERIFTHAIEEDTAQDGNTTVFPIAEINMLPYGPVGK